MPAAGVYLVLPERIATSAAWQMWGGVGKSGSPTERSMTSIPEAAIDDALAAIAKVAEGSRDAIRRARCRLFLFSMTRSVRAPDKVRRGWKGVAPFELMIPSVRCRCASWRQSRWGCRHPHRHRSGKNP